MKDQLRHLLRAAAGAADARNLAREYLQARILETLQRRGTFGAIAFHGGTALRFIFRIPRFSEDLDFALERPGCNWDFPALLGQVSSELVAEGYAVSIKISDRRPVHAGLVRFEGLLQELGAAAARVRDLSIKVEVDTRPPAGAETATTIVRRHATLRLWHHDKASLLAGKLHAILSRPHVKGRDVFDLLWYLSDPTWPEPNLTFLNNALAQTGFPHEPLTKRTWRPAIRSRLADADWHRVAPDVAPFLESSWDLSLLSRPGLLACLDNSHAAGTDGR